MYVVAGIIASLFLLLGILSRKESVESSENKVMRPFDKMAFYLYKRICICKLPVFVNGQVERDLEKLHPGERKQQLCTRYYVNKMAKSLQICLAGTFLGLVLSAQARGNSALGEDGTITRTAYEDGGMDVEVVCELPQGKQKFKIEVAAKSFEEEEIKEIYEAFRRELPGLLAGDNPSLQEVTGNLSLLESYEGYPFAVSWESSDPDIIRSDGTVAAVEEERKIELGADISCEKWEWKEKISVRVMPSERSEEERIHLELEKLLLASEQESRTKREWKLPKNWEGQELMWKLNTEDRGIWLFAGVTAVAFLIFFLADKDLHDEVEKRRNRMKKDYPDIVHKLALYLGAGMTIRGTFQKMGEEYERTRNTGEEQNPVYEEILYACRELRTGTMESVVYERFGQRTGLQEYIRLSTLLAQNLKKGNSTLLQRLREEADKASLERIQYGRRLGEEAMTKLLLPMVMMLLVVMLMIMIPAFTSVGA